MPRRTPIQVEFYAASASGAGFRVRHYAPRVRRWLRVRRYASGPAEFTWVTKSGRADRVFVPSGIWTTAITSQATFDAHQAQFHVTPGPGRYPHFGAPPDFWMPEGI